MPSNLLKIHNRTSIVANLLKTIGLFGRFFIRFEPMVYSCSLVIIGNENKKFRNNEDMLSLAEFLEEIEAKIRTFSSFVPSSSPVLMLHNNQQQAPGLENVASTTVLVSRCFIPGPLFRF